MLTKLNLCVWVYFICDRLCGIYIFIINEIDIFRGRLLNKLLAKDYLNYNQLGNYQ